MTVRQLLGLCHRIECQAVLCCGTGISFIHGAVVPSHCILGTDPRANLSSLLLAQLKLERPPGTPLQWQRLITLLKKVDGGT